MPVIDWSKYPKMKLLNKYTDIQFISTLSAELGVNLYIKRDDLNGIGFGGNKIRKLEFLLGEASNRHATHILTLGAIQSNHARLTAVTSRMKGFEVDVFLKESVSIDKNAYQQNGNITLHKIVDANIHRIPNDDRMMERIQSRMEEIKREGGNPYFIPVGGSNAVGNLGYVAGYEEIKNQERTFVRSFDYIVTASGSGGTHAGLIVGNLLFADKTIVKAYNVQPEHDELLDHTLEICNETLGWFGKPTLRKEHLDLNSSFSGGAYGFPEDYHLDVLKDLAKKEGVFLDPVYTAKAFSGLLEDIRNGVYPKGSTILFIHTGGTPGVFAYADWF